MKKLILTTLLLTMILSNSFSENEKGLKISKMKGNEGKRWAICIGINDYDDENIGSLKKAQNDALALGKVLEQKGQFDKVITMVNDFQHYEEKLLPTKANIEKRIDYILEFSNPEDLIIFSFSGHGISDENGEGYLITQDTVLKDKFNTSLKVNDIVERFSKHNIKKLLLVLDACREEMTETKGLVDNKGLYSEQFKDSEVAATFYSTKEGWFSYEDEESEYGVFTRFLLEGLEGNADLNDDSIVTFSELETYVQQTVNDFSLKHNRKQKPYTKIYGEKYGDLALTIYKKDSIKKIKDNDNEGTNITEANGFKVSLKDGSEYDTIILTWSPPVDNNFDGFIILRQGKNTIDYNLKNKNIYIEGEKIEGTDTVVLKVFDKSIFSFVDTNLKEGTEYFYKIYTFKKNNEFINYSLNGVEKKIKTLREETTISINLENIKVLKVNESSWGVELYWKLEVVTSDGETYILNERKKENYVACTKDQTRNFKNGAKIEFKLPKKGVSYFSIIVDIRDRDDIKDGWYQETGTENIIVNRKAYRYELNDTKTFGYHTIIAEDKSSAKLEINWTISQTSK